MKKRIKKLINTRFVKIIGIPFLLLLLWFGLTSYYIYSFDTALSVISFVHDKNEIIQNNNFQKLLKGQKIVGEFEADDDNLGILSVRFKTYTRPAFKNEDLLVFRIKEKGSNKWLVQNKYMNGLMYDEAPFPFGFPIIPDSKGRRYYFEIESLKGNENNAIALSDKGQVIFSKYQKNKSEMLQDKKLLLDFAITKYLNSFISDSVKVFSFIYLLPFIFYMIWISPIGKKLKKYTEGSKRIKFEFRSIIYHLANNPLHLILFGVILVDIFVFSYSNDMVYLVIIALWLFLIKVYRQSSRLLFTLSLIFIAITPLYLELKNAQTAEKFVIWGFMFLVGGTIQAMVEYKS